MRGIRVVPHPSFSPYSLYEYATQGSAGTPFPGFSDETGKTSATAALVGGEKTGIFIVLGQSLAANHNGTLFTPTNAKVHQINPYTGSCFKAVDPLLGGSGSVNGTWLGPLGDKLINAGTFTRMIYIPVAIGGASAYDWTPSGVLHHRLRVAIFRARQLGYTVSGILYQCGQTDSLLGTSSASYQASVLSTIAGSRDLGYTGPWFIAKCTLLSNAVNATIQAAQLALVDNPNGIYAGPNVDSLTGGTNRSDGTHLTATGCDSTADLWKTVLQNYGY